MTATEQPEGGYASRLLREYEGGKPFDWVYQSGHDSQVRALIGEIIREMEGLRIEIAALKARRPE